jgi:hypothetical protein
MEGMPRSAYKKDPTNPKDRPAIEKRHFFLVQRRSRLCNDDDNDR